MQKGSITLVALLLATFSFSQFLKIGPKAGANLVQIPGQSFSQGFQSGYYAGGFAEMKLSKNFFLQPELLFAESNMRTSSSFESLYKNLLSVDTLKSIKLQTLSIPVMLNWKIANILALSAGPQFSINMNKNENLWKNTASAFTDGSIGIAAGASLMLGKFRVNGRYSWALKDVNNLHQRESWKPQALQLGVGLVL